MEEPTYNNTHSLCKKSILFAKFAKFAKKSKNPKIQKFKTMEPGGRLFWIFLVFSRFFWFFLEKSKKNHVFFWILLAPGLKNLKKHMVFLDFE